MKVTKSYIKQLVKEELNNMLREANACYEWSKSAKSPAGQDLTVHQRCSNSGEPRYFLEIFGDKSPGKYSIGEEFANQIMHNNYDSTNAKKIDNAYLMKSDLAGKAFDVYVHNR